MGNTAESETHVGMGAIVHDGGVAFRVWAPNADAVHVAGSFNDWSQDAHPLASEDNGYWYGDVEQAGIGDDYRYVIRNGENSLWRIDPYAREVTNSVGNSVVHDPEFDWEDDASPLAPWNELVIYEAHPGTFSRRDDDQTGDLEFATKKLDYLRDLGVNAIELMPVAEFPGDTSWGYNPAHIFAVEGAYGGPRALKEFVKRAHQAGLSVFLDVVYNHFGPSDLGLWQFDGWSENGKGGIYFYNDERGETPWGDTRPDYGRPEVRRFLLDNALMWLDEYHLDGLRVDMTAYIRTVGGDESTSLPDGWSLLQELNTALAERFPGRLRIAEDFRGSAAITRPVAEGGAGFDVQWDDRFFLPVRETVRLIADEQRSMHAVRDALCQRYNDDAFRRVIYAESHDEVASGRQRIPSEVNPEHPDSEFSEKRSNLAAALVLTAPGIPLIFQGEEFLAAGSFQDDRGLDWSELEEHSGIHRMYRDLIRLRRNAEGTTRGLTGQHVDVQHVNDTDKLIAFHRRCEGGPGDDVVVIVNFANRSYDDYQLDFPQAGGWRLRFNSDAVAYSPHFDDTASRDVEAQPSENGGGSARASVAIGPYATLIYSQDP